MEKYSCFVALVTVCQAFVNVNDWRLRSAKMLILKTRYTTE